MFQSLNCNDKQCCFLKNVCTFGPSQIPTKEENNLLSGTNLILKMSRNLQLKMSKRPNSKGPLDNSKLS